MLIISFILISGLFGGTDPDISRRLASGAIGCPAKEVGISDEEAHRGVHTFTAHCKGIEYYCTYKHPAPIQCARQGNLSDEEIKKRQEEVIKAVNKWKQKVLEHVSNHWEGHKDYKPTMSVTLRIRLDENGKLLNLKWISKSSNSKVSKSILKAFKKANPYPAPPNPGLAFSGIEFTFPESSDKNETK